jgi:hypothetical protein
MTHTRTRQRFPLCAAALLVSVVLAGAVDAAPAAEQRTAAEELFQQARELMVQKSFATACDKFAASQELDPGLGTQLYLADCYDSAGKSASAWALFREVSTAARRAGEQDRERIADERANDLATRLSKVELHVDTRQAIAGLELRLNDVVIPRASWNTALPLDPGPLHVEARAPGKRPWHFNGAIEQGPASRRIEIPSLSPAPGAPAPVGRADAAAASGRPAPQTHASAQRTFGYVASGVGLAALAVGGIFGYRAYASNQKSKGECRTEDPNACTRQGVALREEAQQGSTISTAATIGGGVLLAGGVVLLLTAPPRDYAGNPASRTAALTGLQLGVGGVW